MAERTETVLTGGDARAPAAQAGERREQRSGYLAFVAHEVRNPLSTALWSAELLARISADERGGPRGEKLAGMCLRALARVRLLVEDHFLSERLDVAGIPVRAEEISVQEALEAAIGRRSGFGAACDVSGADGLVVIADRALLDRAMDALLTAAGQGGAHIAVECGETGGGAVVRFRGAPPAPDALADPDRDTPSDPKGRPLALGMARRIAWALGGSLSVVDGKYVLSLPLAGNEPGTAHGE